MKKLFLSLVLFSSLIQSESVLLDQIKQTQTIEVGNTLSQPVGVAVKSGNQFVVFHRAPQGEISSFEILPSDMEDTQLIWLVLNTPVKLKMFNALAQLPDYSIRGVNLTTKIRAAGAAASLFWSEAREVKTGIRIDTLRETTRVLVIEDLKDEGLTLTQLDQVVEGK